MPHRLIVLMVAGCSFPHPAARHLAAECDPAALAEGDVLPETCDAVFVSAGAPDGDGTRAAPFGSIASALTADLPIYVCVGAVAKESFAIDAARILVGGFTCDTWARAATRSQLESTGPVLTIEPGVDAVITSFAIRARDASDATVASTAVLVRGGVVVIEDSEIVSGNGAPGAPGVSAPDPLAPAPDGQIASTANLCTVFASIGGSGGQNTCEGIDVSGGRGGNGSNTATTLPGQAGHGEGGGGAGIGAQYCGFGGGGSPGASGEVTDTIPIGALDKRGYVLPITLDGLRGHHGGGGGGASGSGVCSATRYGPGGSGGGAGGCGGAGGHGGQAGGGSLALIVLDGTVELRASTIVAGVGGQGGGGASGQLGQQGSQQTTANAGYPTCVGGGGGNGGNGGPGSGGSGGPSIAIARSADAIVRVDDASTLRVSPPSMGGAAGVTATTSGHDGSPGIVEPIHTLSSR